MKHILIIDDDDQMRVMLREMLEREGYKVVEALNGKEGLKRFQAEPADLIITDLIMPEKEGIETIMELKRDSPDVNIVAISGGGRIGPGDLLHMAEKLGAQYTFSKPIARKKLLSAVKDLIG